MAVPTNILKVAGTFGSYGEDGATFTPKVSEDGTLSWTNDKNRPNPATVNIKGEKGDQGDIGPQGPPGESVTPDYSAAEGESGHILNRTHWVEKGERVEILPDTTIEYIEGDGHFAYIPSLVLEVGKTYIVKWNGTEYTCVGQDVSALMEMEGAVALGNLSSAGLNGNGEPFALVWAEGLVLAETDTTDPITISIKTESEIVHKLDPKYLPETTLNIQHATVGQIVAIKAVDDNGKPTEWEAVDNVGGGTPGVGIKAITIAEVGVVLISFDINQWGTYQAEEGMTWAEWIASDYNTIGAKADGTDVIFPDDPDWTSTWYITDDGNSVHPDDVLIADHTYFVE